MIHLLWPTIRPLQMVKAYKHWCAKADKPAQITLTIAVNTEEDKSQIPESLGKIIVDGTKKGVVHAVNILSHNLDGPDDDIVILASDDMFAPEHWDTWLLKTLQNKTKFFKTAVSYLSDKCIYERFVIRAYGVINQASY